MQFSFEPPQQIMLKLTSFLLLSYDIIVPQGRIVVNEHFNCSKHDLCIRERRKFGFEVFNIK